MMLTDEDGGQAVSGAAASYVLGGHYWVGDGGKTQIAEVVSVKGRIKWKLFDGEPKAFVDVVFKGPIERPV